MVVFLMVIYHARIRKESPKKQNHKTKPTKLTKQIIQTNNGRIRKKTPSKRNKNNRLIYSRALALWIWLGYVKSPMIYMQSG